jgi:hypothetical protein
MQPTDILHPVQELQSRRDALEQQMPARIWREVAELISDEVTTYEWRLAAVLAAHLPGMAPTISALTTHALDDDPELGCCGLPARSYDGPESDPAA